jgi:hypothetical protein
LIALVPRAGIDLSGDLSGVAESEAGRRNPHAPCQAQDFKSYVGIALSMDIKYLIRFGMVFRKALPAHQNHIGPSHDMANALLESISKKL